MVYVDVALIVLWLAAGAAVIAGEEVTKIQYVCCWLVLIVTLIEKLVERW